MFFNINFYQNLTFSSSLLNPAGIILQHTQKHNAHAQISKSSKPRILGWVCQTKQWDSGIERALWYLISRLALPDWMIPLKQQYGKMTWDGRHPIIFGGCQLLRNKAFRNSLLPNEYLFFSKMMRVYIWCPRNCVTFHCTEGKEGLYKTGFELPRNSIFLPMGQVPVCFVTEVTVHC